MLNFSAHGFLAPLAAAVLLTNLLPAQAPLTIGNLVVVRVGDGSAALTGDATAVFLDEYTVTGTLVQSIGLPTAAAGLNRAFGVRGNSTSEGFVNASSNGVYLTLAGYDAIPGTTGLSASTALTINRVIARIDLAGNVDTSTALTDAYSAGNPRAAVSDDGQRFWMSGTSTSEGGVRFVANLGASTSVGLNAGSPSNCRTANIIDGQLYTSSASGVYLGVCTVGTGLPTTAGQPITLLNGFPTSSLVIPQSTYDYFFADPNTLYVADDNTTAPMGDGGIQKWTYNGVVWTKQYTLKLTATSGMRGLTGYVQNGTTTLWGTANTGTTQTDLVVVTDTGAGSVVTSLALAPTNTAFRGLRYLAKPTTLTPIPAGCGPATIQSFGNAEIGTDVRTTVSNALAIPLIAYGAVPLAVPLCLPQTCVIAHDFSLILVGSQHTLSLPFNPTFIGIPLRVQGVDFLAPGGCVTPLLLTLTDAYEFTIQ